MTRFDRLFVSGNRDACGQRVAAFRFGLGEEVEQRISVGDLEVPLRHLTLVFEEHLAVTDPGGVESEIVNVVDALNIHRKPFQPVGQFACDRLAIEPAHLLEVGELGDFHPVAPDLPAQPPCAERWRFPVILDKADIMRERVDADGAEALEIEFLDVTRRRLQDHLILVIMLQTVGVFAVAPVGRTAAGLHECGVPRLRPQRAQRGCSVESTRPHAHIIGLQNHTALRAPEVMEVQDHVLKRARWIARCGGERRDGVHGASPWPNAP